MIKFNCGCNPRCLATLTVERQTDAVLFKTAVGETFFLAKEDEATLEDYLRDGRRPEA